MAGEIPSDQQNTPPYSQHQAPQTQATQIQQPDIKLDAPKPSETKPKANFPIPPIVAALLVVILILIGVYLFYPGGNSNSLLSQLSNNKTAAGVIMIASQKLVTSNQFNVSYEGNANLELSNLALKIPILLSYQKYYNNSRFYIDATGIPLLGNITSTFVNLANGTSYACSRQTTYSLPSNNGSSSQSKISCIPSQSGNSLADMVSEYSSKFNSNSISNNTTVKILGQRQYKNQDCVLVELSGSDNKNNTVANYNATMCLSNQYNVPLNLTLSATESSTSPPSNGNTSLLLSLNEVSIGNPVSQASVTALPGPIASANQNSLFNSNTTGNSNFNNNFASGNLTCTPLNVQFNCSVSPNPVSTGPVFYYKNGQSGEKNGTFITLWISQNTNNSWNNVNITYVPSGAALNANGIPEAVFNPNDSENVFNMYSQSNSMGTLVTSLQVSSASSGSFNGTLWATYTLDSNPNVFQYSKFAKIEGKTG